MRPLTWSHRTTPSLRSQVTFMTVSSLPCPHHSPRERGRPHRRGAPSRHDGATAKMRPPDKRSTAMRLPTLAEFQEAAAFVHETLDPTPQIAWPLLAERTGCQVWVKHENHTPIGAFKVRGGLVFMDDLRRHGPAGRRDRRHEGQSRPEHRLRRGPARPRVRPGGAGGQRRRQERGDGGLRRRAGDPRRGLRGRLRARPRRWRRSGASRWFPPSTSASSAASAPTRWSFSPPCPTSTRSTCRWGYSAPASAG